MPRQRQISRVQYQESLHSSAKLSVSRVLVRRKYINIRTWWVLCGRVEDSSLRLGHGAFQCKRSGIFIEPLFMPQTLSYHPLCPNQGLLVLERDLSEAEISLRLSCPEWTFRWHLSFVCWCFTSSSERGASFHFQHVCADMATDILTCMYLYSSTHGYWIAIYVPVSVEKKGMVRIGKEK